MSLEPAAGIDLGTTFSSIAHLDERGRPRVIPNLEGDICTPSVVYFHESGTVVGKEAVKVARYEPDAIAQFAKRDMGKAAYHRPVRGRRFPPEVIQALVLRKLKQDAAAQLGELRKAVITVPAFFNEPRRKATMDAGRLAGLEVLDIINEPTAAAMAYGVQEGFLSASGETRRKETVLVYDLGGGTFDVTLMEIDGGDYRAVATDGDVFLGGIDWDRRIVDYVAERFLADEGVDPRQDPEALHCLMQDAEDAKRALTARDRVPLHFAYSHRRICVPLTRELFESLTVDLVERTVFTANSLLAEAKRTWADLTRILLVGGSSRMPMIQRRLEQESGRTLDRSLLAEEPVALGAAIYAGILLAGGDRPQLGMTVQNVSSHHLGVLGVERETGLPRRKVLIPRNTPLPAAGSGTFCTWRDNQSGVLVQVIEGGDDSGKNATPIGNCIVSGLPPGLPAGTRVKVRFAYGANGRLAVKAILPGMAAQAVMTVERASGLSEDRILDWLGRIEQGVLIQAESPQQEPAEPAAEETTSWLADEPTQADSDSGSFTPLLPQDSGEVLEGPLPDGLPAPPPSAGPSDDPDLDAFLRGLK